MIFRKIFLYLFLLILTMGSAQAAPVSGIVLGGAAVPTDSADTYPVTDPQWGLGGNRTVGLTSDRNAIPLPRLQKGMLVFVEGTDTTYRLKNDWAGGVPVDADWEAFGSGNITGAGTANSIAIWNSNTSISENVNLYLTNRGLLNSTVGLNIAYNTSYEVYVDTATGNDSNLGTIGSPWATIQYAINQVPTFLSGQYIIHIADGTYSEALTAPAYFAGRSVNFGGAVMVFQGNTTTPANVIISASGSSIFENDYFGQSNPASFIFDGIRFVGDNSNSAVSSAAGNLIFGAVEFAQLANAVTAHFNTKVIFQPNALPVIMNGITEDAFSIEDGALVYLANSVTGTNFAGSYVHLSPNSSFLHDENLVTSITTTSSPTPNSFPALLLRGDFDPGRQNQFNFDGFDTGINIAGEGKWTGGRDNQFDCANCNFVASLSDNSTFTSSFDGSGTYTVSGATPSTDNFYLHAQSTLQNELNSGSGSPEIPYVWLQGTPDITTSGLWLANDWRYKGSQTVIMPGTPTPSSGGWISPLGLADFAYPLYTARKNEVFNFIRIKTSNANGPNGGAVTDTYTVYVNGVATTMAGTIVDGDSVNITVNPRRLAPWDEVSVFALFGSNTLAQNVRAVW